VRSSGLICSVAAPGHNLSSLVRQGDLNFLTIFRSGLRSQLAKPYGPVFFTVSKKGSGLEPDRIVTSLQIRELLVPI
jgi:hypothetical protein